MHTPSTGDSDELEANIPTAIVIKNIPFSVKREQLVEIMGEMSLPLPYAFNYHFDGGVFRGLAFANFTTPDETVRVINALNHYELQGRKLRVEYKRMLPAADRDRIEREKRERRGQLQEQHQPMSAPHLHNQESMSSLRSNIPASASPAPYHAGEQSLEEGIASMLGFVQCSGCITAVGCMVRRAIQKHELSSFRWTIHAFEATLQPCIHISTSPYFEAAVAML
jgi:RNA recognition motif-containing protein